MTPPVLDLLRSGAEDNVTVSINGVKYKVPRAFSEVSLNEYLRCHLLLTGTKVMCREGGCGVCVVTASYPDPEGSGQIESRAINSCLCPILSCDGWEITTVEGIGDQTKPHSIQKRLEEHYATQCGYCTPGMVMSMYSLFENNGGNVTSEQVEAAFGGNLCRCTGYRPILEACKTFAKDSGDYQSVDVEDLGNKICKTTGKKCGGTCVRKPRALPDAVRDYAPPWHAPKTLDELYDVMKSLTGKHVYYVVGHTGIGVYNDAPYDAYVNLKGIPDLYSVNNDGQKLSVGANVTLTDLISLFQRESQKDGFKYLDVLAGLLLRTAQPPVRNAGSWAGNMSMKNRHNDFPSETFVAMTISGASIVIGPEEKAYSSDEFLTLPMDGKVILRCELPTYTDDYVFVGYKVMPRAVNAHALVNAGLRAKVDKSQPGKFVITEKPVLVFLNIQPSFVHAPQTETFLTGKDIGDQNVLQQALQVLEKEVQPDEVEAEASPKFKRDLSLSLFYKFALEIVDNAAPKYRSAIGMIPRPVSSGAQIFDTKKENWPLGQPIPKLEALVQCTGEAKFVSDIEQEGMLHAAFAVTTEGNASIYRVETTDAMALPGVIRVFTAADIPGKNNVGLVGPIQEELLASKQSNYAGMPVAIVVGETKEIAEAGAKLVKVEYSNVRDPILTAKQAGALKSFFPMTPKPIIVGDADGAMAKAAQKLSGEYEMGTQNHFYMETMTCVSYPTEDGLNMEAGTQYIDGTQQTAADCTGLGKNKINVTVRRNGGSYGGKIFRNAHTSSATAVAAWLLKRPVKMHMQIGVNSYSAGKRYSYYVKYQAGTDKNGKLVSLIFDLYMNIGFDFAVNPFMLWDRWGDSSYLSPNWKINMYPCKTNLPQNTWCRAPGSLEAFYFLEYITSHIAFALKKPTVDVKRLNFHKEGDKLLDGTTLKYNALNSITDALIKSSDYQNRMKSVTDFNQANKWRKRGLYISPMRYPIDWAGFAYNCNVGIYHNDGTIAVVHGGVEIGQGINTKVAQVVAYELGVDLKYISIQPSTSISNPNAFATGGSVSSELCCLAAISACEQLKTRLQPTRNAMANATWPEQVEAAYGKGVDLFARGWVAPPQGQPAPYNTYGAMASEVEMDILTGEYQVNRCDLLYDCGESLSPYVDIGQIEGAVVMGMGYFTSEEVIYDKKTGVNLTPTTWKYKPPSHKDIPVDFRVALLQNAPNPSGVLRSKTAAEPPLCLTVSVILALRECIQASLNESGQGNNFWQMDTPLTVERAQQYAKVNYKQFRYRD